MNDYKNVNLLNNIDKNRYIVNLYLEKKRGVLLNKMDKDVVVMQYKVYNIKPNIFNKVLNFTKRII